MTAAYDPDLAARIAVEAKEDDARMTRAPWTTPTGTRFLGAVSAVINGFERQVAASAGQAPQFDDVPDVGRALSDNAAGIARTRNNLAATAEQLAAAQAEIARLRPVVEAAERQFDRCDDDTSDVFEAVRAYRASRP